MSLPPKFLTIDGVHFRDQDNREVTLRGINCAGDCKLPAKPYFTSHRREDFFDGDNVSFVGRPFPLDQADLHFSRLRNYGYNVLRYLITWEALEAKGPKQYDEEFVDFTIAMLRKAKEHGFMVIIDPHQDVWSRFSGGSGAPMWTLYAMGLNPQAFDTTQAALVHNTYPDPAEFPKMIWSTNYQRMANQVAWTLFFAGKDYAPKAIIDGMNIQDYLQSHFLGAMAHLAERIRDAGGLEDECVIGWESINEPNRGLVGYKVLDSIPAEQKLQKGTSPTAWQAILTGSGRACEIDTWDFGGTGPYRTGRELVDPKGVSAWLPVNHDDTKYGWKRDPGWKLGTCIWAQHGVWDPETDTLLKNDYFSKMADGTPVNAKTFTDTYFMDYYRIYAEKLRSIHKNAIMFMQPPVLEVPPVIRGTNDVHPRLVYTPHFYDGITLMTKRWNRVWNIDVLGVLRGKYLTPAFAIRIGEPAIRNCLRDQLATMKQEGLDCIGPTPCLFSEIGIPYDMDDKRAYTTGDFVSQIRALDANHFALEGAGLHYTLWVYTANNSHEWGDQWNGEDLSIFSPDDHAADDTAAADPTPQRCAAVDPATLKKALTNASMSTDPGEACGDRVQATRAAEAFVRPSPVLTAGTVREWGFDLASVTFRMVVDAVETREEAPTELFVPAFHFPEERTEVEVTGGRWELEPEKGVLRWWHGAGRQEIKIVGVGRRKIWGGDDEGYVEGLVRNVTNCTIM